MFAYSQFFLNFVRKNQIIKTMRIVKFLTIVIVALLATQHSMAQTDSVFKLVKEDGHFYFEAGINGVNAKVMLESGVPGLMMSEGFYEANKEALKMDVKEADERIHYLGGIHTIKYTAQARLQIGDAIFEGPVKIAEGNHKLMIPINMLHHASDNSSIVKIDFKNNELSVCKRENLQDIVKDEKALNLTYNQWRMPVVNTTLNMTVDDSNVSLKGNFIVDMGNASLLFLNKSQGSVVRMLKDNKVKLLEARDRNGKVVSEGIFADKLIICNKTYTDASVGVSQFKSLEECGFLGLKFFTMPAVFDFDNNKMYLCK